MTLKIRILPSFWRLLIMLVGLTMTWYSEMLISARCICGFMRSLHKKSWTVSNRRIAWLSLVVCTTCISRLCMSNSSAIVRIMSEHLIPKTKVQRYIYHHDTEVAVSKTKNTCSILKEVSYTKAENFLVCALLYSHTTVC